jgi:hypothetical protein
LHCQAVAKAAFPQRVPYARAERLINAALGRAEALHQQFLAQLPESLRESGSYARMLPSLRAFCTERLGLVAGGGSGSSSWDPLQPAEVQEGGSSGEDELEAEMARALLHLWLHFDEECAARADQVRSALHLYLSALPVMTGFRAQSMCLLLLLRVLCRLDESTRVCIK